MGLTAQESECIDRACGWLADALGGVWKQAPGPTPDDLFPNTKSPDAIVTNGARTAAIEVKRLIESEMREYRERLGSLSRSLAPSEGRYTLAPCLGFKLPASPRAIRHLKTEIARVGPKLLQDSDGPIRVPRSATLTRAHPGSVPGRVFCTHADTHGAVRSLELRVPGVFYLNDDDAWEHEFVTDSCRAEFDRAIQCAAVRCSAGDAAEAQWDEEWQLYRHKDDPSRPPRVSVVAVSDIIDATTATDLAVGEMLTKAASKFDDVPHETYRLIVLDGRSLLFDEYASDQDPTDFNVDCVLLVVATTTRCLLLGGRIQRL